MFTLPIIVFLIIIFFIIQVSIWSMLPLFIRNILFANPVLAFLINLAGSNFIVAFTGIASLVGIANMGASVAFGVYAWIYKSKNNIKGLTIGWVKVLGFIPVLPKLEVVYLQGPEN
jgi:hypothetical protein